MSVLPLALLVTCGLTDLAVASAVLLLPWRPERRIGVGRVVAAAAATGFVFFIRAGLLARWGVHLFGLVHLLYIDLVIVLPALGLLALAVPPIWKRLTWPTIALAGMSAVLLPVIGAYASLVEPFRLQVERAEVGLAAGRSGTSPIRIAVLSDLQAAQVTGYERSAIDRLMALEADLILVPGDVLQVGPELFADRSAALRPLLQKLRAPGGVFVVQGDVDGEASRLAGLIEGTGLRLLVNEQAETKVGNRVIRIGGVGLDYDSSAAYDTIRDLNVAPEDGSIRILLAHRPDVALEVPERSRIDLVVAGHTHGGQVVVPGFGPLMTLSHVPRSVAAGGLHEIGGNRIYVSRGVGCERGQAPRLRFFCPPEISLITVR
jgi:predicted MPP superfamily phosphohydrolase